MLSKFEIKLSSSRSWAPNNFPVVKIIFSFAIYEQTK